MQSANTEKAAGQGVLRLDAERGGAGGTQFNRGHLGTPQEGAFEETVPVFWLHAKARQ